MRDLMNFDKSINELKVVKTNEHNERNENMRKRR